MKTFRLATLIVLFASATSVILPSCSSAVQGPESRIAMGTLCSVNLYENGRASYYERVFSRLYELEGIFSPNIEGSDLYRINQSAGIEPVLVRRELIIVLQRALEYAELSDGLFNPTLGPLINLWGISSDSPAIPGDEEIQNALSLSNFRNIIINLEGEDGEGTVFLTEPGMLLDLGAIAKGFIADELAALIRSFGVNRAIIDLGGDIFALGERSVNENWNIGLQDPLDDFGSYLGIIRVSNSAITSSGVYERFFISGGIRYHHIISGANGFPANNGYLSVTIISDNAMEADALSTLVFLLEPETGMEIIESIPGVEGIIILEDLRIMLSPGIRDHFTLINDEYTIDNRH